MVNVSWCPYISEYPQDLWKELALIEPKPLKEFNSYTKTNELRRCPAHLHTFTNTYEIQSPIDFTIQWEHGKGVGMDMHEVLASNIISLRENDYGPTDYQLLTLNFKYIFASDSPCYIEVTPAYQTRNNVFRAVTGRYDISTWLRPVDVTIEFWEKSGQYTFTRGEPLMYVKFYPLDPYEKINLKQIEFTKEIGDDVLRCVTLRDHWPGQPLKNLYQLYKQRRKWKP